MAIKINFALFERTFKVIYEDPLQLFRTLVGFRNILTKNSVQSDDDLTSRVNLLKLLHVGLNFFEKFLKML
jgi:uncharacterized protein YutE (UPF0331/DUF86 family)